MKDDDVTSESVWVRGRELQQPASVLQLRQYVILVGRTS